MPRGKTKKTRTPHTPRGTGYAEPPAGGREATGAGTYDWWNPTDAGETISGVMVGSVQIKNNAGVERRRFIITAEKRNRVLPDHVNLERLITNVESENGGLLGVRVWIQYLGKKAVAGVAQPMAQYRVRDYGKTAEKDVPF